MSNLYVISGSSGVGKGTLIRAFLNKHPEFALSISCTTRNKRPTEVHGKDYFFLSSQEFDNAIENDEFLEWAVFSGNKYGTKKEFVLDCLQQNKNLILEIDTQGALQIKNKMSQAILIFVLPPSLEALEERLRNRHTEKEEDILKRLDFVKTEIKNSDKFDYTLKNDTIENALLKLEKIINV